MYRKIAITLIAVGVLVAGYGIFTNSTAQASHGASHGNETRAIEASTARYSGLAEYYAAASATGSTFFATNPELMAHNRYALEAQPTQSSLHAANLATNPELMAHNRYALEAQPTQSSLHAANPEQTAFGRTAAEVEWQRTAFPGR